VILNPMSKKGRGAKIYQEFVKKIGDSVKVEVLETTHQDHAQQLASETDMSQFDVLLICGGDGTVNEVLNGIMERKPEDRIPFAILPGGSGNDGVRCLNQNRVSLEDTISMLFEGTTVAKIDLGCVKYGEGFSKRRYFLTQSGWGPVPVGSNKLVPKYKLFGSKAYDIAALHKILAGGISHYDFKIDDRESSNTPLVAFIASNGRYTGGGMKMAPLSYLNDGKMDITLIRRASKCATLDMLGQVEKATHIYQPLLEYYRANKITLTTTDEEFESEGDLRQTFLSPLEIVVDHLCIEAFVSPNNFEC